MEATKQRALVRVSTVTCKKEEKERTSSSSHKVVEKGAPNWKSERKDDRPFKKGLVIPVGNQ